MNGSSMDQRGGSRGIGEWILTILLVCGILSSLLYVAADVLAASRWEGYRYADRAVSELLAVGSPTRAFIVPPMIAYNFLILAFGIGVWMSADRKRSLKVTGALLVTYSVVSLTSLVLFPLRPDSGLTASGAMPLSGQLHTAATVALVLLMFAFIGFGSGARGLGFRVYSIATIAAVFAGGMLAGTKLDAVAGGLVTPWFGLIERSNIYSSLLWVVVLAGVLLVNNRERAARAEAAASGARKTVTVFVGSPHRGGATFAAVQQFVDRLTAFGDVDAEIVALGDYDIGTCRGCALCMEPGEEFCPLKDDRDVLIGKMLASDGVVFASPNYSFQVSAQMKIFLDRLGFLFHRPRFHGKTSSAIVVFGIYGGTKVRKYLEFVGGGLGFNVVRGTAIRTLAPMTPEATRKMETALAEQAARFHDGLLLPAHRTPALFPLVMFRMGRTAMGQSGREGTRDFAYYRDHGWFESDYYYETRLGLFKRAVGAFADWAVARMPAFKVAQAADEGPDAAKAATG